MDLTQTSELFDALGQQTRLTLLLLLLEAGSSGVAAGEIAARLKMPLSTTSFHLGALERVGFVASTRQGRQMIYAANVDRVRGLRRFLGEICGDQETPSLDVAEDPAPAAVVEQERVVPAFNVLFLCTRNSARSVMAEAILAKTDNARFNAYSAGNEPAEAPMQQVLQVLVRQGHNVEGLRSKSWDQFLRPEAPRMDFVIGLCDTLTRDFENKFGPKALYTLWPLPDPTLFRGSEVQMGQFITQVYAGLKNRLEAFIRLPFETLGRAALRDRLLALTEDPTVTSA